MAVLRTENAFGSRQGVEWDRGLAAHTPVSAWGCASPIHTTV